MSEIFSNELVVPLSPDPEPEPKPLRTRGWLRFLGFGFEVGGGIEHERERRREPRR